MILFACGAEREGRGEREEKSSRGRRRWKEKRKTLVAGAHEAIFVAAMALFGGIGALLCYL